MTESTAPRSSRARDLVVIALTAAALFLPGLGARDLWNPNEPIYGLAVREMAQRGEWLVPSVNEQVYAEKPILYYWIARAASAVVGGVSEASVRVPSALASVAIVLFVYLLVAAYTDRHRAGIAALLAATTFGIFWNARYVQMDTLVTATTLGTIVPALAAIDGRSRRAAAWSLAGLAAGLGFLAKGPVGWICPGIAVVGYAIAVGRWRELLRPAVLAAAGVAVAVAAPWYLALALTGRAHFVYEVLIRQNFSRFVDAWDHAQPWWYYLQYIWIDGAPWSWLLPLAVARPGRDANAVKLDRLCWSWLIGIVVFFSLSDSKRSPYILPALPAAVILASGVVDGALAKTLSLGRSRILATLGIVAGVVLFAGGGWLALSGPARAPQVGDAVRITGTVTTIAGLAILVAISVRRRIAPHVAIAAFACVFLVATLVAAPAANVFKSARAFCGDVARVAGSDAVVSFGLWRWRSEYVFYLGRPMRNLMTIDELEQSCAGQARTFVLVEEAHVADLRSALKSEPVVTAKIGSGAAYLFACDVAGATASP